jgi:hypothetical protein
MRLRRVLLLATFVCLLNAPSASAQLVTVVELVRGTVRNLGTADKPSTAMLEERDRLVIGTRIRVGPNDRVVLVQTRDVPGGPRGGKQCVTWTIIGGVDLFTVREGAGGSCQASLENIRIADDSTKAPFVQQVVFVNFVSDKADFKEPPMLTRLRNTTDTMRLIGQTPDVDLAVSFSIEGKDPGPFSITGVLANKSRNFYPCVLVRFFLGTDGPDGTVIKVGSLTETVRRIRANEKRTFHQPFTGKNFVGLESVTAC